MDVTEDVDKTQNHETHYNFVKEIDKWKVARDNPKDDNNEDGEFSPTYTAMKKDAML